MIISESRSHQHILGLLNWCHSAGLWCVYSAYRKQTCCRLHGDDPSGWTEWWHRCVCGHWAWPLWMKLFQWFLPESSALIWNLLSHFFSHSGNIIWHEHGNVCVSALTQSVWGGFTSCVYWDLIVSQVFVLSCMNFFKQTFFNKNSNKSTLNESKIIFEVILKAVITIERTDGAFHINAAHLCCEAEVCIRSCSCAHEQTWTHTISCCWPEQSFSVKVRWPVKISWASSAAGSVNAPVRSGPAELSLQSETAQAANEWLPLADSSKNLRKHNNHQSDSKRVTQAEAKVTWPK